MSRFNDPGTCVLSLLSHFSPWGGRLIIFTAFNLLLCAFESYKVSRMGREKSPGLKILWIWTIGTAAILVTSVVRTRMQDMQSMINQNQNTIAGAPVLTDETVLPESDPEIAERLK